MKFYHLKFLTLIAVALLTACQSTPTETYKDYFYQTKDDQDRKQFTFILYLGDDSAEGGMHSSKESSQHVPKRKRGGGNGSGKKKNQSSKGKSRKSGKGDYTSIAFKMEEEAYRRLELRLKKAEFCGGEVIYDLSEYTWLKYTIKGRCRI